MESKNRLGEAIDLLAKMQKEDDDRIPAVTFGYVIDRLFGVDQVKDVVPISGDEYRVIIRTDECTNEMISFSFQVYHDSEGKVNLMSAKVCMDEFFNYGEADEVRILEHNEVSGRPEGVISYLISKIRRYFTETGSGDYSLTLDF